MSSASSRFPRLVWILSLVVALAFLLTDSVVRVRGIHALTDATVGSAHPIARDPATPSGYEGNQHQLILPIIGTDGYHWAMQTQQMLAGGGARIRWSGDDGPPQGRAVHWSSLLHWWTAGLALIAAKVRHMSVALAVELVMPWANTAILALLLIVLVPVVARRFGALAASLLAVGAVSVYPVYEFYVVGNYDHHGVASSSAMLCVLCLLAGGAGWVQSDAEPARLTAPERATRNWLLNERAARRWFIASGVAGGAGLWISAATMIPALFGIGAAALVSTGLLARGSHVPGPWRTQPNLWRVWGMAGAGASVCFYLLEYFPSHMGLRLEVNHPLYALAWLGAADLLFRVSVMMNRPVTIAPGRDSGGLAWVWIAADVGCIAIVPAIMLLVPESFILRPNSLVIALHEDYIREFRSLPKQIAEWSWIQFNAGVSLLPLMLIGPAVALAARRNIAAPLRALATVGALPALVYTTMAFRQGRWLGVGCALWLATLVAVTTILTLESADAWHWPVVKRILIGAAASLIFAMAPVSRAQPVLVAMLVVTIGCAVILPTMAASRQWTTARLVGAGAMCGLAFAPFPALSAHKWIAGGGTYPLSPDDFAQVVTRDVSRKLRARLGAEQGVIASGPTTTTWMTYFGGFHGVSTLYWENREGLTDAAKLFGATDGGPTESASDSAYKLIRTLGVTHVVLYSWNPFAVEYARLAQGLRAPSAPSTADDAATQRAFASQLLGGSIPVWLRALPYRVPPMSGFDKPWALVLEVVPDQTPKEAATRLATFCLALNDEDTAIRQLDVALHLDPEYVPALITLGRVQAANPKRGEVRATEARIQRSHGTDSLVLEDNIGLATLYMQTGDTVRARAAATKAIAQADERSIRRLPWDYSTANFVLLARQLNLTRMRPAIVEFAFNQLDPAVQAQLPK